MNFLLHIAGHLEGLSDEQINRLEGDIPYIRALVAIAQKAKPLIAQANDTFAKIAPDIQLLLTKLEDKR